MGDQLMTSPQHKNWSVICWQLSMTRISFWAQQPAKTFITVFCVLDDVAELRFTSNAVFSHQFIITLKALFHYLKHIWVIKTHVINPITVTLSLSSKLTPYKLIYSLQDKLINITSTFIHVTLKYLFVFITIWA